MKQHTNFPEFTIDTELSIAYLRLSDRRVVRQEVLEAETVIADIDDNGGIVGVEILSLTRFSRLMHNAGYRFPKQYNAQILSATLLPLLWRSRTTA
ncbi:MAG: DUF2283 domain-containing protein [Bacteroidia bacterium]|nr:DUF2283 domain-containing protein [Bacteroidia bacterium]